MSPRASADPWGFFCSGVAAARSQCFNVLKGHQGRNKGRIGMREDNGATRDVARTYREALRREKRTFRPKLLARFRPDPSSSMSTSGGPAISFFGTTAVACTSRAITIPSTAATCAARRSRTARRINEQVKRWQN